MTDTPAGFFAEFLADFLAMGGYAAFVWPCYGLTAAGMIWLGMASWHRARKASAMLAALTAEK